MARVERHGGNIDAKDRRRREKIGNQITQYRKEQGLTVGTASQAPAMIANFQDRLAAALKRIQELEKEKKLLQEELDSYREHEEAMTVNDISEKEVEDPSGLEIDFEGFPETVGSTAVQEKRRSRLSPSHSDWTSSSDITFSSGESSSEKSSDSDMDITNSG